MLQPVATTFEVVGLRKEINARVPEAFEVAASLMFGESSLAAAIEGRMVPGHTLFPTVKGAAALYHLAGKSLNLPAGFKYPHPP